MIDIVQKAFAIAQDLRTDPFAIKRKMVPTPDILTPLFQKAEIVRENLAAKSIIGYGQVATMLNFPFRSF